MHQSAVIEQQQLETLQADFMENGIPAFPKDMVVYRIQGIQGPFFFGAAEKIEHALATTHTDPRVIIFRLRDVPFIDMTGLETFNELIEHYHKRGVAVYVCEANSTVRHKLAKIGILNFVIENKVFNNLSEILSQI